MQNLLILMSDEHQARAMGCADHDFVSTPNLDRLAAQGIRFTDAYTPSPICVPARAAFASGRHVHQTGHWDNAMPYVGTPAGWGHQLQGAGIRVESIGKLHYRYPFDPAGFDKEHIPMMVKDGVGMIWASVRQEEQRLLAPQRMLGSHVGIGESPYTRYDAAVTERAVEWIHQTAREEQGWCLYVGLVAPHFPLVCSREFYQLYDQIDFSRTKLHPSSGYRRHPWVEKQNAFMDTEASFEDRDERRRAFVAYYGLVSWLDHNVGRILDALESSGLQSQTLVVYSSDHGDNVGARGLWGKSNLYEEAAAVPMIMSGPGLPTGTCRTPVSLVDLSCSIPAYFGLEPDPAMVGTPLQKIAGQPEDPERTVFSEYHAAGAVTGAFMLRKGRYKLIHYVGFEPELFDLEDDPEEIHNLASDTGFRQTLQDLMAELSSICDPEEVDRIAHEDQHRLVGSHGGLDAVRHMGARAATPPPEID